MFCSWLKTRDHVLPSKDTWVQLHTNQNAINTGVHSSQQNNLYSQVGSKHFNNVPWQRQGMFQHDLLGISGGEGRDETSKSRTTIKYMCTHPHLSLSLYINTYFLHLNFTALLSWQRMVKFLLSWALLSVLCTLLEIFFGGGCSAFQTVMFKCTSFISNPTWMKKASKINFSFSFHKDKPASGASQSVGCPRNVGFCRRWYKYLLVWDAHLKTPKKRAKM